MSFLKSFLPASFMAAATLSAIAPMQAQAASFVDYNLVVFEDLTSNSEVEGNAFIGGNLEGSSSNFCTHCYNGGSYAPSDGFGLKVVGDINGNPKQVNNGANAAYGGVLNSIVNTNGGGTLTTSTSLTAELNHLRTSLTATSSHLSPLASNSSVLVPGQQPGAVRFNSSGDSTAIFNISAAALFSQKTQQIELNLNGSDTAIINVSGSAAKWQQGNMVGGLVSDAVQQKVLWNFYEAENLEFNNALHGSLLAPMAHLINRTELEGNIVIKSLDQKGEVHLPVFTGIVPPLPPIDDEPQPIPEPSTVIGSLAVLLVGRTLKKKQSA